MQIKLNQSELATAITEYMKKRGFVIGHGHGGVTLHAQATPTIGQFVFSATLEVEPPKVEEPLATEKPTAWDRIKE
jgi:hypothetical protein